MFKPIFALSAVALMLVGSEPPKNQRTELEGEWTIVSCAAHGKEPAEDYGGYPRLKVCGNTWQFSRDEIAGPPPLPELRAKLNTSTNPKRIDVWWEDDEEDSVPLRGIYRLEGDTLTLCAPMQVGDERPKDFKSGVEIVYKRVSKKPGQ